MMDLQEDGKKSIEMRGTGRKKWKGGGDKREKR
jgi:hypothetical protein